MTNKEDLPQLIPPHGGFRDLQSYQMAEIVFDATVVFCNRFINRRSRTHDKWCKRSGAENKITPCDVIEGCMAFVTCLGCLYGQGDIYSSQAERFKF
jgi:restriction system protein